MKLNPRIFKTLDNPVETQDVNGRKIEIHYMNDTQYFARYAQQGQFAVWTSDGSDYKLLIERDYLKTLRPLYTSRINDVWIRFYEKATQVRNNIFLKLILPILITALAIVIIFAAVPVLRQYQTIVLIGILVVVLASNILQSTLMKRRIESAREEAVIEIKETLGEEQFKSLIEQQGKFYDNFFDFTEEDVVEDAVEQIEGETKEGLEAEETVEEIESETEEALVVEEKEVSEESLETVEVTEETEEIK